MQGASHSTKGQKTRRCWARRSCLTRKGLAAALQKPGKLRFQSQVKCLRTYVTLRVGTHKPRRRHFRAPCVVAPAVSRSGPGSPSGNFIAILISPFAPPPQVVPRSSICRQTHHIRVTSQAPSSKRLRNRRRESRERLGVVGEEGSVVVPLRRSIPKPN
ncbi:hypothetical protein N657DRAFT_404987 [Parathielavia appendiculata]|uniref:Uncharacterized protein n=1 Tax=Parathielavia appendiculata TaxID=2587402 RepID=A0AAN6TPH8_9PEZI|nr:hypothetical protein N657DRAFT_404987 [Parathielavia appendiculata]